MANSYFSSKKVKLEEIEIFIDAIEEGYINTINSVLQKKLNYLRNQTQTEYIVWLESRLTNLIKRNKDDGIRSK